MKFAANLNLKEHQFFFTHPVFSSGIQKFAYAQTINHGQWSLPAYIRHTRRIIQHSLIAPTTAAVFTGQPNPPMP